MGTDKHAVTDIHEVAQAAIVESRGPAPIKPKGKGRSRPVIVTDAEGKPKRVATHDRLLEGLLEREGVEAVVEGKRPRVVRCIDCGDPIQVQPRGKLPMRCAEHAWEHHRATGREHSKRPETRRRQRDRYQRPDVRETILRSQRERYAGDAAFRAERDARKRRHRERPEVKARNAELQRAYRARKKAEREAAS